MHSLLTVEQIDCSPNDYLSDIGEIFALFGESRQDSGNTSYGVKLDGGVIL